MTQRKRTFRSVLCFTIAALTTVSIYASSPYSDRSSTPPPHGYVPSSTTSGSAPTDRTSTSNNSSNSSNSSTQPNPTPSILTKPPESSSSTNVSSGSPRTVVAPPSLPPLSKRFAITGPILTVTLKDPYAVQLPSSATTTTATTTATDPNQRPTTTIDVSDSSRAASNGGGLNNGQPTGSDTTDTPTTTPSIRRNNPLSRFLLKIRRNNPHTLPTDTLGLSSLSPSIVWAIRSTSPPLPRLFPRWRSVGVTTGYRFEELRNAPSYFEGNLDVALGSGVDLNVSPSYTVKGGLWGCVVRIGGSTTTNRSRSSTTGVGSTSGTTNAIGGGTSGSWFGLARFTNHRSSQGLLQLLRGSYQRNLPFATLGSLAITPTYDTRRGGGGSDPLSCHVVGKSGSGRTAAMLDLNWDKPTLSVMHALDERNIISPEISLSTAKIMYKWDVRLNNGSTIRTSVDPTSAIHVLWTDRTEGGKWVTDFRLPLVGGPGPLAGDVRVRRQFTF